MECNPRTKVLQITRDWGKKQREIKYTVEAWSLYQQSHSKKKKKLVAISYFLNGIEIYSRLSNDMNHLDFAHQFNQWDKSGETQFQNCEYTTWRMHNIFYFFRLISIYATKPHVNQYNCIAMHRVKCYQHFSKKKFLS